jgi:uncharacterized protein with HEPN domain
MSADETFVRHMIDAIDEIQKILDSLSYEELVNDSIKMHAIARLFEILGEAAGKLSREYQDAHSAIPFPDIIGMRNKLIHRYFEVDLSVLWKAYEEELPMLKKELIDSLENL